MLNAFQLSFNPMLYPQACQSEVDPSRAIYKEAQNVYDEILCMNTVKQEKIPDSVYRDLKPIENIRNRRC